MNKLDFQPLFGLASPHLQTIVPSFLRSGPVPPSTNWIVELEDGDRLSCEVSIPPNGTSKAIVLVHGMGGCHTSGYMVRMAYKAYERGFKAVRVNLRGCGSGEGLSKLPYNGGTSGDVLKVLQRLKEEAPNSEIVLIGFSLGGNLVLKLAGELGEKAAQFVQSFIAVCAPLDLARTVRDIQSNRNRLYHAYYLKRICKQAQKWAKRDVSSLYEFDDQITAPLWGYRGAAHYYKECSSLQFLPRIRQTCHLLFAKDDPFIDLNPLQNLSLPPQVRVWITEQGGHMGFLGRQSFYWMDDLLFRWITAQ